MEAGVSRKQGGGPGGGQPGGQARRNLQGHIFPRYTGRGARQGGPAQDDS